MIIITTTTTRIADHCIVYQMQSCWGCECIIIWHRSFIRTAFGIVTFLNLFFLALLLLLLLYFNGCGEPFWTHSILSQVKKKYSFSFVGHQFIISPTWKGIYGIVCVFRKRGKVVETATSWFVDTFRLFTSMRSSVYEWWSRLSFIIPTDSPCIERSIDHSSNLIRISVVQLGTVMFSTVLMVPIDWLNSIFIYLRETFNLLCVSHHPFKYHSNHALQWSVQNI